MDSTYPSERIKGFTALLRVRLKPKRYTHSLNVANAARKLADCWHVDPDWAYLAGLLHDCCKEIPHEEQAELMRGGRFPVEEAEWASKAVWHGIAAASYLNAELGIDNQDVLAAVRWHTVAHAGMSRLEEVIYIADLISDDRTYRDVDHFRKLAFSDLDRAMLEALQFSIDCVVQAKNPLPIATAEAYNFYLMKEKQSKTNAKM